jgi:hypothetical protein
MSVALANFWVILLWLHLPGNTFDQYCLQALNLQHRLSFFSKHEYHTNLRWRGGGTSTGTGSSTTTTTPRKYRHFDAPEEYARERSGAYDHYLPGNQWLGRIRQRITPRRRNDGTSVVTKQQSFRPNGNYTSATLIPVSEVIVNNHSSTKAISVLESMPRRRQQQTHIVTNVHELRSKVLDDGWALQNVKIECPYASANATIAEVLQHDVIQVMVSRYHSQSRPGERYSNDTAYLALAIEGGGIRGAVCSGMAAAIASLGLTDSFDTIVGSSAGSVIGAYMVRLVEIDA